MSTWEAAVLRLRQDPAGAELVRDAYYDDPLDKAAERYWTSSEWKAVRQFFGSGSGRRALDLGAGRGIASFALARDGFSVEAVEPDPSDLVGAGAIRALATDCQLPITVHEATGECLPFHDGSIDVVFARAVLHHASKLDETCKEVFRVLKPGGCFLAVREHVISKSADLATFLERHPLHRFYGGENAYLSNEYVRCLCDAGFDVHTLRSFDTPINYFPMDDVSLCERVLSPLRFAGPVHGFALTLLSKPSNFSLLCRILSALDSRAGRHHSFFCVKPQ